MMIYNAKGNGQFGLEVNSSGQGSVIAESISSEGYQARRGNAFVIHAECHTALAASGGFMQITNNSADFDLDLTRIYVDAHTLTPTDLIITQVFDATGAAGTDVTSTALIQKDRGLSNTFDLTVKISDGSSDLTYTGGSQYHAFPIKTMETKVREMAGTNILTANKSVLFGWKTRGGGNATDGEIVSFSVNCVKRPHMTA